MRTFFSFYFTADHLRAQQQTLAELLAHFDVPFDVTGRLALTDLESMLGQMAQLGAYDPSLGVRLSTAQIGALMADLRTKIPRRP